MNTFLKLRYIFYVPLLLAVIFVADKIFLLPEVRLNFIQPGGMLYYAYRNRQLGILEKFEKTNDPRKLAVVFGDSRSFAFGNLSAHLAGNDDWMIFNFAGPQAVPGYHYYLAEKIFKRHDRPDALFIAVSADNFNATTNIFASPVLNYGVDFPFIRNHAGQIPERDLDSYRQTRRFALTGMQFSFSDLIRRLRGSIYLSSTKGEPEIPPEMLPLAMSFFKGGKQEIPPRYRGIVMSLAQASTYNLSHYSLETSPLTGILDLGYGAQYAWFGTMKQSELKRESERLMEFYLSHFAVSEEQFYYYEETLRLAKLAGVRTVVFEPLLNPYVARATEGHPVIRSVKERIARIAQKYGAAEVDLNRVPEASCDQFYDASHLSITCFPPITRHLLKTAEAIP